MFCIIMGINSKTKISCYRNFTLIISFFYCILLYFLIAISYIATIVSVEAFFDGWCFNSYYLCIVKGHGFRGRHFAAVYKVNFTGVPITLHV